MGTLHALFKCQRDVHTCGIRRAVHAAYLAFRLKIKRRMEKMPTPAAASMALTPTHHGTVGAKGNCPLRHRFSIDDVVQAGCRADDNRNTQMITAWGLRFQFPNALGGEPSVSYRHLEVQENTDQLRAFLVVNIDALQPVLCFKNLEAELHSERKGPSGATLIQAPLRAERQPAHRPPV
jgi:hypothetical protein